MKVNLRSLSAAVLVLSAALLAQSTPGKIKFQVSIDPRLSTEPVSGRLIVYMTDYPKPLPRIQPGYGEETRVAWIAAKEIKDLKPGDTVTFDPDQKAFPAPFSTAKAGNYQFMAQLDVDHNAAYRTFTGGDLRSAVVKVENVDPTQTAPIDLHLSERLTDQPPFNPPQNSEVIDFVSPSLSGFWGRPIHMRGLVVLPPDYATAKGRYPTVYLTHGYGANLNILATAYGQSILKEMAEGKVPPMIYVLLDESCPGGTHEFADSVNNGPWGRALTTELIPHLEKKYRMDAKPNGRFLTGHSSGGWATLWLQVNYPTIFGGTWSTSPDPVDFRDFTNVNLLQDKNFYSNPDGTLKYVVRMHGKPVESISDMAKQERVLGSYGGQMASFEWVFSPRGPDGRPEQLFDRDTGAINRDVADVWEKRYDISTILRTNAKQLAPKLKGKLHIIVGTQDTFYLNEPIQLMQRDIAPLGYDAKITFLEGRDHFNLYQGGLSWRIAKQMYDVARPGNKWQSKEQPDAATALTQ